MKIRKIIFLLIISISILMLLSTKSNATLELNSLNFNAKINEDGSMDVVEKWNIYISETNTLYKTFKIDKTKYSSLTNISVKEITNGLNNNFTQSSIWQYHLNKNYYFGGINNEGQYEIAWGVGLDNSSSTRQYEISYRVNDAVKKYGDCVELYWQFVGEQFEINSDIINGVITLPSSAENIQDIKVWGHTENLNGEIYATSLDTVEFTVNKYKAKNYVEIRIAFPTELMPNLNYTLTSNELENIISEETQWATEANYKREKRDKQAQNIGIATIGIIGIIGFFFATKIRKYKEELRENPKIIPETKLDYYRELPDETATPAEACFILNENNNTKTITATILDLTLKGYLQAEKDKKEVKFKIIEKNKNELPEDEQKMLELLEKSYNNKKDKDKEKEPNIISMKDLQKYIEKRPEQFQLLQADLKRISEENSEKKDKFNAEIREKSFKCFGKIAGYIFLTIAVFWITIFGLISGLGVVNSIIKYLVLASLFTIVVNIINIILLIRISKRLNGFTQKGINEREQWKAFKKYMIDFSLLNEKEVPALTLWEKYLVFATAFGIADKVIKQLKIKYPELNNPENINNMVLFGCMCNSKGLDTNFISSINNSTTHMYSSTYSSGGGRRRWLLWRWRIWWPEAVGGGGR